MKKNISPSVALQRAASMCSVQEYCCSDMLTKLARWGIQPDDAAAIIKKLEHDGFINELRFASSFANDKLRYNRWGKIKITIALKQKKIKETIIHKAIRAIDEKLYHNILRAEAEKKLRICQSEENIQMCKNKIIRFLLQKGVEQDIAISIVNELMRQGGC